MPTYKEGQLWTVSPGHSNCTRPLFGQSNLKLSGQKWTAMGSKGLMREERLTQGGVIWRQEILLKFQWTGTVE